MNIVFRFLRVFVAAFFRKPLSGPLNTSVVRFHVLPNDLDFNVHMTNSRYISVMDLGRFDLTIRNGLAGLSYKNQWRPIVASEMIRFRRPLPPFQAYELRTRVAGWDGKWFFFEQTFLIQDPAGPTVAAVALVKALLRGRTGNIAPAQALSALGHTAPSPALSSAVVAWLESEKSLPKPE